MVTVLYFSRRVSIIPQLKCIVGGDMTTVNLFHGMHISTGVVTYDLHPRPGPHLQVRGLRKTPVRSRVPPDLTP